MTCSNAKVWFWGGIKSLARILTGMIGSPELMARMDEWGIYAATVVGFDRTVIAAIDIVE